MPWKFERVAGPFTFTEGPVWDGAAVHFCDVLADRIMRYSPADGDCRPFLTDTNGAGGLAWDLDGRLYACQGRARRVVRYEPDGSVTVLAAHFQAKQLNTPNDLVVDSHGRVWFTVPRYGLDRSNMELQHEAVYRLDPSPDGQYSIHAVANDMLRPNGLALSPDERVLYVAEAPRFMAALRPEGVPQLRAYPVEPDGTLGAGRVLFDFGDQRGIDGLRVTSDGAIVATCGWPKSGPGPRIAVFAPDGVLLDEHPTPLVPTNLVFGGHDLSDVFVTGFDGALWRAHSELHGLNRSRTVS